MMEIASVCKKFMRQPIAGGISLAVNMVIRVLGTNTDKAHVTNNAVNLNKHGRRKKCQLNMMNPVRYLRTGLYEEKQHRSDS